MKNEKTLQRSLEKYNKVSVMLKHALTKKHFRQQNILPIRFMFPNVHYLIKNIYINEWKYI